MKLQKWNSLDATEIKKNLNFCRAKLKGYSKIVFEQKLNRKSRLLSECAFSQIRKHINSINILFTTIALVKQRYHPFKLYNVQSQHSMKIKERLLLFEIT